MKLYIWAAVLAVLMHACTLNARAQTELELGRAISPFGMKLGFLEGVGLDLTFGNRIGLDATTLGYLSSVKARVYLVDKNSSPFVGIGYGWMAKSMADGGGYSYVLAYAGVELASEHLFGQGSVQFPFNAEARSHLAVIPSFSVGYRF